MRFEIVPQNLNAITTDLKEIEQCLQQLYEDANLISTKIAYQEFGIEDIKSTLEANTKKILTLADNTRGFNGGFVSVINLYNKTENKIVSNVNVAEKNEGLESPSGEMTGETTGETTGEAAQEPEGSKKVSYAEGELNIGVGSIAGIPYGTKLSGDLFSASYNTKATAGVTYKTDSNGKYELDTVGAQASISGEAHIASGKIKQSVGCLSREMSATVGEVGAVGAIGANLYKGGKLSPQLYAKAQASAIAAKGSVSDSIGSDNNNIHTKASGELGTAKASAEIAAGKITVKDDQGNTTTAYGATASAGAEAYVATGKVSGGVKILGVQIDVGVTGKAGGAGVKASATATTGGIKGSVGAGLGLGLGLDISIDWSNFKIGW